LLEDLDLLMNYLSGKDISIDSYKKLSSLSFYSFEYFLIKLFVKYGEMTALT